MKSLISSEELDQVIQKLDNLLMEGHLKHTTQRQNYFQLKDKENFNVDTHTQETTNILNEWFKSVVSFLETSIKEKHHLFHFIQHHRGSLMISGMPTNLSNILISFEYYLYALEDIILRLEEKKNLVVRQEIAEKEHEADILYKISYNDHTREIKLNDIVLTKTDFNSENDNCFNYIYANSDRPIGIEELEGASGDKLKKRLAHIVRDLGFVNELKDIFFPVVTKDKLMFKNPISKQYAFEKDLPAINFKKIGRQSKTE